MSGFSGVLQLTDLDDFIGPGQECIKPVKVVFMIIAIIMTIVVRLRRRLLLVKEPRSR